jgi:hypothetical protein
LNNRPAFGRQKGSLITNRDPQVTLSGVKPGLSGLGSRVKVCETPLEIREINTYWAFSPDRPGGETTQVKKRKHFG